jgi:hypothetical protein
MDCLFSIQYSLFLQYLPLADLNEYHLTVNIACEINVGLLQQECHRSSNYSIHWAAATDHLKINSHIKVPVQYSNI